MNNRQQQSEKTVSQADRYHHTAKNEVEEDTSTETDSNYHDHDYAENEQKINGRNAAVDALIALHQPPASAAAEADNKESRRSKESKSNNKSTTTKPPVASNSSNKDDEKKEALTKESIDQKNKPEKSRHMKAKVRVPCTKPIRIYGEAAQLVPLNEAKRGAAVPTEADVLCGRGNDIKEHEGNKRFRKLVLDHKALYIQSEKSQKPEFSHAIVNYMRNHYGTRFLQRNDSTGIWYEIDYKQAVDKTRQALREGAPRLLEQSLREQAKDDKDNGPGKKETKETEHQSMHETPKPTPVLEDFRAQRMPAAWTDGRKRAPQADPQKTRETIPQAESPAKKKHKESPTLKHHHSPEPHKAKASKSPQLAGTAETTASVVHHPEAALSTGATPAHVNQTDSVHNFPGSCPPKISVLFQPGREQTVAENSSEKNIDHAPGFAVWRTHHPHGSGELMYVQQAGAHNLGPQRQDPPAPRAQIMEFSSARTQVPQGEDPTPRYVALPPLPTVLPPITYRNDEKGKQEASHKTPQTAIISTPMMDPQQGRPAQQQQQRSPPGYVSLAASQLQFQQEQEHLALLDQRHRALQKEQLSLQQRQKQLTAQSEHEQFSQISPSLEPSSYPMQPQQYIITAPPPSFPRSHLQGQHHPSMAQHLLSSSSLSYSLPQQLQPQFITMPANLQVHHPSQQQQQMMMMRGAPQHQCMYVMQQPLYAAPQPQAVYLIPASSAVPGSSSGMMTYEQLVSGRGPPGSNLVMMSAGDPPPARLPMDAYPPQQPSAMVYPAPPPTLQYNHTTADNPMSYQ